MSGIANLIYKYMFIINVFITQICSKLVLICFGASKKFDGIADLKFY